MRPQTGPGCYCHSLKELAAAAVQGIDLHEAPPADTPSAEPVALNNDQALARMAGAKPVSATKPAWATNFQDTLNNQEN